MYLWEVLRDCGNFNYEIGKDIGILSHNDYLIKEIVFGVLLLFLVILKKWLERRLGLLKSKKSPKKYYL